MRKEMVRVKDGVVRFRLVDVVKCLWILVQAQKASAHQAAKSMELSSRHRRIKISPGQPIGRGMGIESELARSNSVLL